MLHNIMRLVLTTILVAFSLASPARSETLRVAIVSRTVFYVPLWIAERKDFFKDLGLDVAIEVYDNAEKINEDLKAGRVQISVSTPESVIVDGYRGGSLRLIAGNAQKLPHYIIAKPEIQRLDQLRGARFGVLSMNEGTTYMVRHLAKVAGLKDDEYQILAVGGAPTRWRLLKEGKIDVGLQPFPLSYEAEKAGFNNLGALLNYIPDYQFASVNVDGNWAANNRKTVEAFLRGLRRGYAYMQAHIDEAAEITVKELRTSEEMARRALDDTVRLKILSDDLSVSEPGLKYVFESLKSAGLLTNNQSFDLSKFYDGSYLLGSQRSGQ